MALLADREVVSVEESENTTRTVGRDYAKENGGERGADVRLLKVGDHKYLKPLLCHDCGKLVLIVRDVKSIRCKRCSHRRSKKLHKQNVKAKRKALGLSANRYNARYRRIRAELIAEHPYCSLCGGGSNLTCHHAGGEESNAKLTVLCNECHQAYEAWNERNRSQKRKEERWLENLAGGSLWKNTRKANTRLFRWRTS